MPGYPCCRRSVNCGECGGTAPEQFQLTVSSGTFANNGSATPQGCGEEACDEFNGVFLLDYNPALDPITLPDVTCIWETPVFYACYGCFGAPPDVPVICSDVDWVWRVELADFFAGDGYVLAYAVLWNPSSGFTAVWSGNFMSDCSAPIELELELAYLYNPGPGCLIDTNFKLLLEGVT